MQAVTMSKALGRLMTLMPTPWAADIAMRLIGRPRPVPVDEIEAAALATATRVHWGRNRDKAAYRWGHSSPAILMFHGWGGSAAQLGPLAQRLNESGANVIAVDFTAHGASTGSSVSFAQMIADVAETYDAFGGDYAGVVAHSAGALCMMAARHLSGLRFPRLVCLNPPVSPYPPIRALQRVVAPPRRVVDACETRILNEFQGLLPQQHDPVCYEALPGEQLLLVNDSDDRIADCSDGERILERWPGARRLVTHGLGHVGTLHDGRVAEEVISFCVRKD